MAFSAMLTDIFHDCDADSIRYLFDGNLFKPNANQFKVQTDLLDKLLYADDHAECQNRDKDAKD